MSCLPKASCGDTTPRLPASCAETQPRLPVRCPPCDCCAVQVRRIKVRVEGISYRGALGPFMPPCFGCIQHQFDCGNSVHPSCITPFLGYNDLPICVNTTFTIRNPELCDWQKHCVAYPDVSLFDDGNCSTTILGPCEPDPVFGPWVLGWRLLLTSPNPGTFRLRIEWDESPSCDVSQGGHVGALRGVDCGQAFVALPFQWDCFSTRVVVLQHQADDFCAPCDPNGGCCWNPFTAPVVTLWGEL